MPRIGREESNTGIYHVMLRGINRQDIFDEPGSVDCHTPPYINYVCKNENKSYFEEESKTEVNPESWTQLKGSNEKGI